MGITLEQLRAYCAKTRTQLLIDAGGSLHHSDGVTASTTISAFELQSRMAASEGVQLTVELQPRTDAIYLQADGYEPLALTLQRAFIQAAHGKGKERHANGEPFTEQVMQDMARRFGVGALLGQAFKKSEESQRLPHDRAVAELLGAINYLAGAVIAMERQRNTVPPAANDNQPSAARHA